MEDPRLNKNTLGVRTPPYSTEAEQAVIGGLLLDPYAFDKIVDLLTKGDFYEKRNRELFEAIFQLNHRGEPCDFITVSNFLKGSKNLDENILPYLASLAKETPSAARIKAYAEIVHEHATKRRLIYVATELIEKVYSKSNQSSQELLNDAEQLILNVSDENQKTTDLRSITELSNIVYEQIHQRSKSDQLITGIPTGFNVIDEKTSGLQKGDLIIIAGRPSMGKTSLALNIAEHVAIKKQQGTVVIFSMEMPAEQIVARLFSSVAKINQMHMRNGKLSAEEWTSFTKWSGIFKKTSLYIDDSSALTPLEVCARVRRLKREHPDISLVIVDYLQLMHMNNNIENRAIEISGISRALKSLAREVKVPVVALSQLNRNIESRKTKPQMSDLRESGAIEQDADLIMVIYREHDKSNAQGGEYKTPLGTVNVDVVKQRNGPTFDTKLTFVGKHTRFENYISEDSAESVEQSQAASIPISSYDQIGESY